MNIAFFPHYLIIAAGGGLGAALRFALSHAMQPFPFAGQAFPWGTFCVNILGCLLIGMCAAYFSLHSGIGQNIKLFLIIGILGGFTTFSTFSLESMALLQNGHQGLAALYIAGSALLSVSATFAGHFTIKTMF